MIYSTSARKHITGPKAENPPINFAKPRPKAVIDDAVAEIRPEIQPEDVVSRKGASSGLGSGNEGYRGY